MGDLRKQRVHSALSSLLDNLILCSSDEDKTTADEWRGDALEWAKGVIDEHANLWKVK